MALKIGDNFSYNGKKPLDARNQFTTIAEMTAFPETSLDEGHISYVKETGKYYTFNPSNDVDITLGKWRELNTGGSSSDEKVKLSANSESSKYLNELIDNVTIIADGDTLKVITLDGLNTTVATLNLIQNLDKDIMLYLNSVSNPMTFKGVVEDDEALATITDMQSGDTYIVQSSASNGNKTMTFIYNGADFIPIAETTITVRNFTTEPIDLSTETTGALPKAKIDTAIARLADVLDKTTYKGSADGIVKQADKLTGLNATIANLNAVVTNSHTHANKATLDKIVANGIGEGFLADNGQYISFLHLGTTTPSYDSQLWIDNTDPAAPVLKIYDGTAWIEVSSSAGSGGSVSITVDEEMSDTSTNPIQNKVVKKYVDNKAVTVSKEDGNAIQQQEDGLYVEDFSEIIDGINFTQKFVNRPDEISLIKDDIYGFQLTAAATVGSPVITTLNQKLTLKESILNFDYIDFMLSPQTGLRNRPPQITRVKVSDIVYNNSKTLNHTDGSILNFTFDVGVTTQGSFGTATISVVGWFMDETSMYLYEAYNPFDSVYWSGLYYAQIFGANATAVINPVEYVNEDSGLEDTPVGHIIACMANSAPKHYLTCDGTVYNITDYPHLAEHFKTEFGSYNYFGGDGSTTFAVPDLRGEFLRGTGTATRETGTGLAVGIHQDATIHTNVDAHYEENANYISVSRNLPQIDGYTKEDVRLNGAGLGRSWVKLSNSNENTNDLVGHYTSRPTNTSVLYCIKYEPTYYMQNTYSGNVYSTDEQIIGKWLDGKTLYQRSFKFGTVKGEAITVFGQIEDMDLGFVDGGYSYYINTNTNFAAANTSFMLNSSGRGVDKATYTSYVVVQSDGTIVWYTGADVATSGGVCTVKYTKKSESE